MKLTRIAAFAALSVAMISFASCKKDEAAPEPDPIVPVDIFFSASNGDYCYYAAPGTTSTAEITVVRLDSTKADSYAIKVNSATDGITIPEEVTFAQNVGTTTIKITTPSTSQALDKYDFDIKLTGENVNSSASSDKGTIRCEGTVYVYQECITVGSFDNGSNSKDYLGYFKQTIWKLADNKMIIKNFLGSDYDLSFKYSDNWSTYGYDIPDADYTGTEYVYEWDETEAGYEGSKYLYFYKAIDSENGEYETFAPKGDKRIIDVLGLYLGNNYSCYYKTDKYDYLSFTVHSVNFYGESENIDKSFSWLYYLYFDFVDEADLSKYDFVNFPEVTVSEYPTANTDVTAGDGEKVLNFSFYYGGFSMDSQVAKVETVTDGTKYTVSNLWKSGVTTSFTMKTDGSVAVDGGTKAYLDSDGYYYFYDNSGNSWDYFYWTADYSKCISSLYLTAPGDSYYNYWGEGYAYVAINYQYWNGAAYTDASNDYLKITW